MFKPLVLIQIMRLFTNAVLILIVNDLSDTEYYKLIFDLNFVGIIRRF